MLCCLTFLLAKWQCRLVAENLPRTQSTMADALSRNNLLLFCSLLPQAASQPTRIPPALRYSCFWCLARLDLATLDKLVDQSLANGLAPSTRRVYGTRINKYVELCRILKQPCCPASELLLCRYIVYLARNNISHNTIKVYLSAVCQHHLRKGISPPQIGNMPRLYQVLQRICISQASCGVVPRKRLPMQPSILRHIKQTWEKTTIDHDKRM